MVFSQQTTHGKDVGEEDLKGAALPEGGGRVVKVAADVKLQKVQDVDL